MSTETDAAPIVLTPEMVAAVAASQLGSLPHVSRRVLWCNETSEAGVLTVAGGHALGPHTHRINHHHMWVIDGHAIVLGTRIGAGSYVHIPAGVEHDIDATTTEGCTVFYLYQPPGS
jgi:mannose-6-phosphate isomerase-like protein (cupin superfamily)